MTRTITSRPAATVFAALVAAALWIPTVTVPQAQPDFAGAPVAVELA